MPPHLSPGSAGAASELAVAADLIRRGRTVFRKLSPNGPVDLIAQQNGVTVEIDVKSRPLRVVVNDQVPPRRAALQVLPR